MYLFNCSLWITNKMYSFLVKFIEILSYIPQSGRCPHMPQHSSHRGAWRTLVIHRKSFHSLSVTTVMHQRDVCPLWFHDGAMIKLFTYIFTQYCPWFSSSNSACPWQQQLTLLLLLFSVFLLMFLVSLVFLRCKYITFFILYTLHLNYIMSPKTHHYN